MSHIEPSLRRRDIIASAFSAVGLSPLSPAALDAQERLDKNAPVPAKDNLRITKLETILVKPRWLFLKIHTKRRHRWARRADYRRPCAHLRRSRERDRALPRRQGS